MRIHYLASSTLISDSANAVHVMKMAESLTELGHQVTLHGLKGEGESDEAVFHYYGIDPARHFQLKRHDQAHLWLCRILMNLKKHLPVFKIGGLISLIYGHIALKPQVKTEADIAFARNMYWLHALRKNVPFIYETHSPPQSFIHRAIEKSLFASPQCMGIVVISDKLKEIYLQAFPDIEDKIIVAHDAAENPVNADNAIKSVLDRPVQNIGYVGHVYQGRGIDIIIEMAKALPAYRFHIVGGRADLVEELKALSPDNMIYHGHRPYEELTEFYKTFDVVLAPYQKKVAVHGNVGDTSQYMSPLKIFEYMAWGLPIICSDLPVLREVLTDQKNALLVEPDSPQDWINALKSLGENQTLKKDLSMTTRNEFLAKYTWTSRARAILSAAGFSKQ